MEYKPVQKKNSSWTPTTVHKKGKSPGKLGHFSIQPKSNPSSAPSQEIGEYSRASADRLAANVMRGIQAKEQEQAEGLTLSEVEGSTLQRKSESPWAPTFDAPPPIPQSPASQLKGAFAPVSENPIQRQCADCAKEEKEQAGEAGKDLEEIGIQTKLTVGETGDPYEQEADRVASQVMSMSAPADSSASVQRQLETNNPKQIWQRAQSIKPVVQRRIDEQVQMRELVQRAAQIDGNQASGDLESRLNASKGGGSPLSEGVRGFMEPRFGADFSGVRVHTGSEAVQMNRELGAQAFTHGSDVYFGAGKSPGNNELTAHELVHVEQQNGSKVQPKIDGSQINLSTEQDKLQAMLRSDTLQSKKTKTSTSRTLKFITMKRKNIALTGDDKYGHWWTEVDGSESYGWWPKYPVSGLWETLTGVDGELNGITSFGGMATTDPHHGDSASDTFHPKLINSKTDTQVKAEIRSFASSYSGEWRWTFGWGQNCHTFQKSLMSTVGLVEP
ncbi:eCIS core domain-containing protein [Coleofasciculus chthonoplastes]|uniref:eCIS core domain-containing protein n=1 Tax=Coleofasciculus chthonoplastes TaxID=64178 RepID=UPI0032FF0253